MRDLITKTVRSPLLHFLVIGAAIYVAYAALSPEAATESPDTIRVSTGDIAWMEDSWQSRWNRPPTPEERQGLIDAHVRETALYREALAMGLDQNDVIIRRRLAQKLEFLFQDLADAVPVTGEELETHFAENRDRYQDPEVMTFMHVFVDPDRRGDQTLVDAEAMLAELAALEDPAEADDFGDPFMLQAYYPERSEAEVGKLFGREFARSAFELEPGAWHGPVLSGYGVHLVYVHGRDQSPPPEFEAVRDSVQQDLQDERRQKFNDDFVAGLLGRYEVIIEEEATAQTVSNR